MAALFGVLAALLLGVSDFFASRAGRIESAFSVTRTNMAVSTLLGPLLLLIKPWQWSTADAAKGVLAGASMSFGLVLLYHGYRVARIGVVAPTSSVVFAFGPLLWGASRGELPGVVPLVGMVVAAAALFPTTWTPGGTGSIVNGLVLGASSGVLFAVAFITMSEMGEASGLLPLWIQRMAGLGVLALVQPFERSRLVVFRGPARWVAWAAGVAAMAALTSLQLGYGSDGNDAVVSIAASQFATVLVVLAVLFNKEHLRWWQAIGVAASGVGVALMALG
jgi:drug/metabolite transporter (DMT)-like permease